MVLNDIEQTCCKAGTQNYRDLFSQPVAHYTDILDCGLVSQFFIYNHFKGEEKHEERNMKVIYGNNIAS